MDLDVDKIELAISCSILFIAILIYVYNPLTVSLVLGGSMEPTLSHGDMAVAIDSDRYEPEVDDIIIFQNSDGYYVIHRTVEIYDDNSLATKGDANVARDQGVVTDDNYEGNVFVTFETSKIIPERWLWDFHPTQDGPEDAP